MLIASGCSHDTADEESPTSETTSTTASTTSTTVATTTSTTTTTIAVRPPPTGPPAPLTMFATYPEQTERLGRPAMIVKIDNAPEAMPQSGLGEADVVFEIHVEGISRFMAVFHANAPDFIGPIRSARYSDPDLLAMFGRPLFGDSGANTGVLDEIAQDNWIVHIPDGGSTGGSYFRGGSHAAPHNLYTRAGNLYRYQQPSQPPPAPIFSFLAFGETNPGAQPVAGVSESVGSTRSSWVWDGQRWLRWQFGQRHSSDSTGQISAANVLVLECQYLNKHGLPTAVSTGSGALHAFIGGTYVPGTWTRADRAQPFSLTSTNGVPIKLNPGVTWIELTNGATSSLLDQQMASALLTGA